MGDDVIRYDGGIDDSDDLGYEGADVERVFKRAHYEADEVERTPEETPLVPPVDPDAIDAPLVIDHHEAAKNHIDVKKAAGAAGAAVVLAATLGTASIDTDQVTLPEPVPIVQTFDLGSDNGSPDVVADADSQDEKRSGWELFLKLLKYLIVLVIAVVALIFGLVKGCASCAIPALVPDDDKKQEQQDQATSAVEESWMHDEGLYSL